MLELYAAIVDSTAAAAGVITGIWADSFEQHALIANVVITPLALVSGALCFALTLHEP